MRDDDDSDLQLLHVVLQPDESIEIQMVGRLIQEQDLRLTEDDLGDSDTHAPTSGKLFGWDREVTLTETETCKNLDSFGFSLISINVLKSCENFSQPFRVFFFLSRVL